MDKQTKYTNSFFFVLKEKNTKILLDNKINSLAGCFGYPKKEGEQEKANGEGAGEDV